MQTTCTLAKVVTQIQAFSILARLIAYHIGACGLGGSEGSVHLSLEGDETTVEKALELVKFINREPPVSLPDSFFVSSAPDTTMMHWPKSPRSGECNKTIL